MMGRRGRKAAEIAAQGEPTAVREELETRWREHLVEEPRLATMVSADGAQREPFHRWMRYRQGFSPSLVRLFLQETAPSRKQNGDHPVFDPFAGSGTTIVESARHGVRAVGVEALASLVFVANAKWARTFPPMPAATDDKDWRQMADRMSEPVHRAALMLAVARQYTSTGRPNPAAPPLPRSFEEITQTMATDLLHPLTTAGLLLSGDARRLSAIADQSVGAILTSPPYLARYNYRESASPLDAVYRHWYPDARDVHRPPTQLQASRSTTGGERRTAFTHAAVIEVCEAFEKIAQNPSAATVRAYFDDMRMVLRELARVSIADSVCWLVVGGARIKDVYVPADLILADLARDCGWRVQTLRVARDLIPARRKFGRIGWLSPRETVLVLTKV